MSDIRKNLEKLADELESLKKPQQPKAAPLPVIKDRSLSGNCITGGTIENFASTGIVDNAKSQVLEIQKDGIKVSTAYVDRIGNDITVQGDLDVKGEVTASKLHVKELTAENRNDALNPVEFKLGENSRGNGLIWTGGSHTKQLKYRPNPDRIWSSESIDLYQGKQFTINNQTVLTEDSLGTGVVNSKLRTVGTLETLAVSGSVNIDDFVTYSADTEKFAIGTEFPNGMLSIGSFDHQFIIDPTESQDWKIGTWTTGSLDIITDDTSRVNISASGDVLISGKTTFERKVNIGVKNSPDDVDLAVGGAIRFQNKKQQTGNSIPTTGVYRKGDIVWNTDPRPTNYVGWVCVREGSPGEWKPFGQIAS